MLLQAWIGLRLELGGGIVGVGIDTGSHRNWAASLPSAGHGSKQAPS